MQRAVGGEHAVARDDDRERVRAERGADGAGGAGVADRAGDLAVGGGLARADRAGGGVDAAAELVHAVVVERDVVEVALLTGEQRDDAVDGLGDRLRQRAPVVGEAGAAGHQDLRDARIAPFDADRTECGVEHVHPSQITG